MRNIEEAIWNSIEEYNKSILHANIQMNPKTRRISAARQLYKERIGIVDNTRRRNFSSYNLSVGRTTDDIICEFDEKGILLSIKIKSADEWRISSDTVSIRESLKSLQDFTILPKDKSQFEIADIVNSIK